MKSMQKVKEVKEKVKDFVEDHPEGVVLGLSSAIALTWGYVGYKIGIQRQTNVYNKGLVYWNAAGVLKFFDPETKAEVSILEACDVMDRLSGIIK